MEDQFNVTEYKSEAKDKYIAFLLQMAIYAVIGFVVFWLWRAFVNDYGLIGKTLSEALVIVTVDSLFFVVKFFGSIAIIYGIFLSYSYRRKIRAESLKTKKFQAGLMRIRKEYFPLATIEKNHSKQQLVEKLMQEIPYEDIRLPNDQLEAYLEERIKELSKLFLPDSYPRESRTKTTLNHLSQFPKYIYSFANDFINQQNIPTDLLINRVNYVRKYENTLYEANNMLNKHLGIISAGNRGEERVDQELSQFAYFSRYLSNVRIEVDGSSIETDNILFSTKGIFLFEVKNFSEAGKYSLRITKDGQWQRIYPNGEIKPMEKDVTTQHNRHLFLLEKFVREQWVKMYEENVPTIFYHPLIVIANDTIMIENQTDIPIIRISQIYHYVQKVDDQLSQDTVDKLENLIKANQLPLKMYPIPDYTNGLQNYNQMLQIVDKIDIEMEKVAERIIKEAQMV